MHLEQPVDHDQNPHEPVSAVRHEPLREGPPSVQQRMERTGKGTNEEVEEDGSSEDGDELGDARRYDSAFILTVISESYAGYAPAEPSLRHSHPRPSS